MVTLPLSRVRDAAEALARADAARETLQRERDAAVAAALENGATWVQVQEAAGLSPRGVALAIRRHRERTT